MSDQQSLNAPPRLRRIAPYTLTVTLALAAGLAAHAQAPEQPAAPPVAPATPHGKVLFSRQAPSPDQPPALPALNSSSSEPPQEPGPADQRPATPVSNAERSSLRITSLRLDVHLIPATAREEVRAELTLHNATTHSLSRLPLQLSRTLRWQSASTRTPTGPSALAMTQSPIATDADHTGYAQEAILTPATPLAAGADLTVSVFYTGAIAQTAARLELIGAPPGKADATDWDAITATTDRAATALRGFGDVLWYPVAQPTALFGDTNKLFELIRRQRRQNASATISLRLTVEYLGDPPVAAIFDTVSAPLAAAPDTQNELVAETHGTATADFPLAPIGFRAPSLFLTAQQPAVSSGQLLCAVTPNPESLPPYVEAAAALATQLTTWLGPGPATPLILLDHAGEPFEDQTLIVARLSPQVTAESVAPELVRGLTHAWFDPVPTDAKVPYAQAPQTVWLSFGVAELMGLIATENLLGRETAIKQLQEAYTLLALSEPAAAAPAGTSSSSSTAAPSTPPKPATPTGPVAPQPLITAYSDPYLRYKSLSVLWQLREQLGEEALQAALVAYHHSLTLNPALASDERAFETSLERSTGKDLRWFFTDWVYTDPGLPDLSFGPVNARPLPAVGGRDAGYLVAVEVRNDGGAAADVPVTVSNETLTATQRVRIAAHATASVRVIFEGVPRTVQANDGSVPESGALIHIHTLQ